jgi:hypothetical protein
MNRRPLSNRRAANATAAWAAVALALAPCASGCSFLFSEGAPDRHGNLESFQCGDGYAPPVLDTIAGGLLTLDAIGTAGKKDATVAKAAPLDQPMARHDVDVAIGLQVAFAALAAAGAIYGYQAVASCREAQDTRMKQVTRARVLPLPYGVPPYGAPPAVWPPRPPTAPAPATPSP